MIWAVKQLAAPFRYLRIHQGGNFFASKRVYDWCLPAIMSGLTTALCMTYGSGEGVFSEKGILGGFQKLLEILIPFFIVALAAVATFERDGLDEPMKGRPAVLSTRRGSGELADHVLTRRQYISYLFGYLSSLSLIIFVLVLIGGFVEGKLGHDIACVLNGAAIYLKTFILFVFLFALWQLIIITLLGVYFLSDRLQVMNDPER